MEKLTSIQQLLMRLQINIFHISMLMMNIMLMIQVEKYQNIIRHLFPIS